jgi:hypothetical protein
MNPAYTKKLIVSTIALSLVLGGGSLYAARQSAFAQTSSTQASTQERGQALHKQQRAQHGTGFPVIEEAASIIGTDKETLKKSLKQGKSIVDVAREKGISEADLTAKLLELRRTSIDEAVKAGKIDANRADKMKQKMAEHLKLMLNEKDLLDRHDHHMRDGHHGMRPDPAKLAETLGLSKDELVTQLKAGKSLTEIAAAKGISKEQLIGKIKEQLTPSIEKMVDRKNDPKSEE